MAHFSKPTEWRDALLSYATGTNPEPFSLLCRILEGGRGGVVCPGESPVCLAEERAAESALPNECPGRTRGAKGINGEKSLACRPQGKNFLPRPGSHHSSSSDAGARI